MITNMKKLNIERCGGCGYIWASRVPNPKECPYCKKYLIKEEVAKDEL
jgi:rubrerythrin